MRSALAPVPVDFAFSAIARRAPSVKWRSTFSSAKRRVYCLMIAFLGCSENIDEVFGGQLIAVGDAIKSADEFGDHAELDEIFGLHFGEEIVGLISVEAGSFGDIKADGAFAQALGDDLIEMDERAADDKEDVLGVDLDVLLVRMLATPFRRHVGDSPFHNFKEGLLHPFSGNIAGDGDVAAGLADLIDLIDIDNACLCTRMS